MEHGDLRTGLFSLPIVRFRQIVLGSRHINTTAVCGAITCCSSCPALVVQQLLVEARYSDTIVTSTIFPPPTMLSNQMRGFSLLLSLSSLATCLPQTAPPAPPAVTVKNMTVYGTGCPIGGGPVSQQTKAGAPVFVFREWGLSLPDTDETPGEAEKFCVEQISLGDGPVGMQVRVKSITIGGWAQIDADTKISLSIHTNLGGMAAGVS